MRMRSTMVVAGLLAALTAGGTGAATAAPGTLAGAASPSCGQRARVEVFREGGVPLLDWRENLEFDGRGTLWVSNLTKHRVEGYAPDGTPRGGFRLAGPGGIRRGPDGMMYVNYGVNPLTPRGGVVRFDPAAAEPRPQRVVEGIYGINGLAVDSAGNLYLSRELSTGILKIRPDGTRDEAWTKAASVFGSNGLDIVGDQLYVSVLTDPTSRIVRVPLDDPGRYTTVARLTPNPLHDKFLDDLTHFRGDLVVAGFRSGELIRVDPATGRSCVLATGLRMPTSVRAAQGFGGLDPEHHLFAVEASGRIVKVTVD
ncbi:SMP-30/gluconolactonase/LRE family protein [Streptomyces sp. CA-181903]|uniref:SMP-30/gluconolactonase/LRE family protein n=1 Tax=Streptomyces sp. CA-181903 TaxID=3240055 RepID=UPI003D8C0BB5